MWDSVVRQLRDEPVLLAALLSLMFALNMVDLLLTTEALGQGATEANPLMRALLAGQPGAAILLKLASGAFVAAGVWILRSYRRIIETAVVIVLALSVLMLYHVVGALALV